MKNLNKDEIQKRIQEFNRANGTKLEFVEPDNCNEPLFILECAVSNSEQAESQLPFLFNDMNIKYEYTFTFNMENINSMISVYRY